MKKPKKLEKNCLTLLLEGLIKVLFYEGMCNNIN